MGLHEIHSDWSDDSSRLPDQGENVSPIRIAKLRTDNGSKFRTALPVRRDAVTGDRIPSGRHVFDVLCKALTINTGASHRAIHKQTAWSSASTAASARSLNRSVLVLLPRSNQRCTSIATRVFTTKAISPIFNRKAVFYFSFFV